MQQLLEFLDRLEAANLQFVLGHYRESIDVLIAVPGQFWEVEFFADDTVEVEVFVSRGGVSGGAEQLEELFQKHAG